MVLVCQSVEKCVKCRIFKISWLFIWRHFWAWLSLTNTPKVSESTGFCYWISHLCSWLRPVGSRVQRLCSRIRRFHSRIPHACTSIRRLGNRIRRLCNWIRCVCFRISRVCTRICHGYNDSKKLTTSHKVNNFCHGGCHLRQKKAAEVSFTCRLAS